MTESELARAVGKRFQSEVLRRAQRPLQGLLKGWSLDAMGLAVGYLVGEEASVPLEPKLVPSRKGGEPHQVLQVAVPIPDDGHVYLEVTQEGRVRFPRGDGPITAARIYHLVPWKGRSDRPYGELRERIEELAGKVEQKLGSIRPLLEELDRLVRAHEGKIPALLEQLRAEVPGVLEPLIQLLREDDPQHTKPLWEQTRAERVAREALEALRSRRFPMLASDLAWWSRDVPLKIQVAFPELGEPPVTPPGPLTIVIHPYPQEKVELESTPITLGKKLGAWARALKLKDPGEALPLFHERLLANLRGFVGQVLERV